MAKPRYAISLKQPWAALVAAGLKTVEVRTWPTQRRGWIFIHASKTPDERPEAWKWIDSPELQDLAADRGGVLGAAEITDCIEYDTAESFAADQSRHYNDPSWFRPPRLFGFALAHAKVLPFKAVVGNTNFFQVDVPWFVVAPPEKPAAGKDPPDE
jgi:hypothetical protein